MHSKVDLDKVLKCSKANLISSSIGRAAAFVSCELRIRVPPYQFWMGRIVWLSALVLKTRDPRGSVSSNLIPSAK